MFCLGLWFDNLIDWLICRLTDWLIDILFIVWLTSHKLVNSSVEWSIYSFNHPLAILINWLVCCLIDRLINWQTDSLPSVYMSYCISHEKSLPLYLCKCLCKSVCFIGDPSFSRSLTSSHASQGYTDGHLVIYCHHLY